MINKALGLIETYGYVPAVEACDACLKAANIELIGFEFVSGGLVTIKICGEVSAVKASIDAGATAAKELGRVISVDVIARTGIGLEKIIYPPEKIKATHLNNETLRMEELRSKDSIIKKELAHSEKNLVAKISENIKVLKDMKVVDLRKIARQIDDFPMIKGEIKYAKKMELIEAIKNYLKNKGE
ncbi:BMC domain-containing protein [Wukongibacter baidiensis]|uniref:BMC domain-containing protein n=1 Tax=Wukongibacter baidiensis TaxID=1723361 RepID=UPI003D7F1981